MNGHSPSVAELEGKRNHEPGPRESTFESADQAAGIYSLYGDGTRDSWRDSTISDGQTQRGISNGRVEHGNAPRTPLRNSFTGDDTLDLGAMEELGPEYGSTKTNGAVAAPAPTSSMNGRNRSSISSASGSQGIPTPDIMITPIKSNGQRSDHDSNQDRRGSTLSANTTPTHPSVSRLSPRHPLGGSTTSATSSASGSVLSYAGSSQYPGEEEDAFRVRSTCEFEIPDLLLGLLGRSC